MSRRHIDEQYIEQSLEQMKEQIPINEELKQQLRSKFTRQRRRSKRLLGTIAGTAAVVALVTVLALQSMLTPRSPVIKTALASTLNIANQVSFADLIGGQVVDIGTGQAGSISEANGSVYMAAGKNGLYVYDEQGYRRILTQTVQEVAVNKAGTKLLLTDGRSIGVYDLQAQSYMEVLPEADSESYVHPTWKDEATILYSAIPGEESPHDEPSVMYEMNIADSQSIRIGEGTHPSYSAGEEALVYQRGSGSEAQVVRMDMQNGEEIVLDSGRQPSVSVGGAYVVYIKSENGIDQVWIADVSGESKRAVTHNVAELDPTVGTFSYDHPVWDSEGQSLYVLRQGSRQSERLNVMRIDLSQGELGAVDTVEKFNQAVIRRDLDYARSLLANDQEFLILSNPVQVGYSVIGSGEEEGGRKYVDIEEYWGYTANAYYMIAQVRYYMTDTSSGYMIEETKKLSEVSVGKEPDGSVTLYRDGREQRLFARDDIPQELLPQGEYEDRFASLALVNQDSELVFTLQIMSDVESGQKSSVIVLRYDIDEGTFEPSGHITSIDGFENVGIRKLTVSSDGHYAALDMYTEEDLSYGSRMIILDLQNNERIQVESLLDDTEVQYTDSYYWEDDGLHFRLGSGEQTVYYQWMLHTGLLNKP